MGHKPFSNLCLVLTEDGLCYCDHEAEAQKIADIEAMRQTQAKWPDVNEEDRDDENDEEE